MDEAREDSELARDLAGVTFTQLRQLMLTANHPAILSVPAKVSSHTFKVITQVSLMTFSKVVISTSVKIWSVSGISRAPLEDKDQPSAEGLGQRNRELTERGIMVSAITQGREAGSAHLRKMLEWFRRLSRAESRSGHFLCSSTRKNNPWHSFLSSVSFSFNI